MQDHERGVITGHYIFHWGVPKEIRPHRLRGVGECAIMEFAPKGDRTTWRYATNGMSSYVQNHPNGIHHIRTELYCCTKDKAAWIDDLLAALATYPLDYNTYLSEYDTINVGQPVDRKASCFTGILLAPPRICDPETLGLVGGLSENVLVHQVIGIFPAEVEYAKEYGGKMLFERVARNGDVLIDTDRPAVL